MILSAQDDISAPIEDVFAVYSDFEGLEAAARRHGIEIARTGSDPLAWRAHVDIRGRRTAVDIVLGRCERPRRIDIAASSSRLTGDLAVEFTALARGRTRVQATVTIEAHSIPAGMLLQTLKLGHKQLQARFAARMTAFAVHVGKGRGAADL